MFNFRNYPNITSITIPEEIKLSNSSFYNAFYNMINLKTINFNHPNVTNMYNTYCNCRNLTGNPVCGNNVTNMRFTYYYCRNLSGSPVCGNKVTDMSYTYFYCDNLTGSPVCGNNVTDMSSTYYGCRNLSGSPVCGNNVTDMYDTYHNCYNLTGSPVCGNKVANMSYTYYNCTNLTGSPVCGPNVTDMSSTYYNCSNLTGSPVCGNKVANMSRAYNNCRNLTGSPVCGNKVANMSFTYCNCYNLTGNPVCGNNVTDMYKTYYNCTKLTGSPVCGNKVTDMSFTYYNCKNLTGNIYMYSNNIRSVTECFYGKNNSRQYNIYAYQNTNTWNTLYTSNVNSIVGANITWTNYSNGDFYNTGYNIYVHGIGAKISLITFTIDGTFYQAEEGATWYEWCQNKGSSVGFTCESTTSNVISSNGNITVNGVKVIGSDVITNGLVAISVKDSSGTDTDDISTILQDFEYINNGDGTYTITAWKGTKNGVASDDLVIPPTGGKVILK